MLNVFELLDFELILHDDKSPHTRYIKEFSEFEKKIYARKKTYLNNKEKYILNALKKGNYIDLLKEINNMDENKWMKESFSNDEITQIAYMSAAAAWLQIIENNEVVRYFPNTSLYELIITNGKNKSDKYFDEEILKKIVTGMLIENITETDYDEGLNCVKTCLNENFDYLTPHYSTSSIYDLEEKITIHYKINLYNLKDHELLKLKNFVSEVDKIKESLYLDEDYLGMLVAPLITQIIESDKDISDNEDEEVIERAEADPGITTSKIEYDPLISKYIHNQQTISKMGSLLSEELTNKMSPFTLFVADKLGNASSVMIDAMYKTDNCNDWGKIFYVDSKLKYDEKNIKTTTVINEKYLRRRKL